MLSKDYFHYHLTMLVLNTFIAKNFNLESPGTYCFKSVGPRDNKNINYARYHYNSFYVFSAAI